MIAEEAERGVVAPLTVGQYLLDMEGGGLHTYYK